ncbi:MAG: hypothetical protein GYA55_00530 [SAR324 cluster bacterium]|uniref:Uncharacterized protein n=1 Tax=SAR324 cluster bacterium TaxID=2024889 RepID=A0A7X9III1_9DELT|nr:hypothetical protein [SAR324 cluster bacterium]
MDENKSKKTDLDIASDFDRLFDQIPEPDSQEDVKAFLEENGYDIAKLKVDGLAFIDNLISSNWRFADIKEIHKIARKIDEFPIHIGWDREKLTKAIQKLSATLNSNEVQTSLAFRNLENLTDTDLATILQELEFKASLKDIPKDLD